MEITADTKLPLLRDELQFLEGAADGDGQAGFLIFDPVRHSYFRIGLQAAQAFAAWGEGTVGNLMDKMQQRNLPMGFGEVEALVRFVRANSLVVGERGGAARFVEQNLQQKRSVLTAGLH
ncbi:MAG TPA: hypothetical protein ENJ55_07780, partial [Rhizobiales bacterium]|nr:hypothetical protein [Hyphomicrobiales bacterium]